MSGSVLANDGSGAGPNGRGSEDWEDTAALGTPKQRRQGSEDWEDTTALATPPKQRQEAFGIVPSDARCGPKPFCARNCCGRIA